MREAVLAWTRILGPDRIETGYARGAQAIGYAFAPPGRVCDDGRAAPARPVPDGTRDALRIPGPAADAGRAKTRARPCRKPKARKVTYGKFMRKSAMTYTMPI